MKTNNLVLKALFILLVLFSTKGISQEKNTSNKLENDLHKQYESLYYDSASKYEKLSSHLKRYQFLEEAEKIGEEHYQDSTLLKIYTDKIPLSFYINLDISENFKKYIDFSNTLSNNNNLKSKLFNEISLYYINISNLDLAAIYLKKADSAQPHYTLDYNRLILLIRAGKLDEAVKIADKLEKNAIKNNSNSFLRRAYLNKGQIYAHSGQYESALSYYRKLQNLNVKMAKNCFYPYFCISDVYSKIDNRDSTYKYLMLAHGEAKRVNSQKKLMLINYLLAVYYGKTEEFNKSIIYSNSALKTAISLNLSYESFINYEVISEAYYYKKDYVKALFNAEKANQIKEISENQKLHLKEILTKIAVAKKNFKKAYFYLTEYNAINDSINKYKTNENSIQQLTSEKEVLETKIKEKDAKLINSKKTYYSKINWIILFFTIVFGLLVICFYKLKKRKEKIDNLETELKNLNYLNVTKTKESKKLEENLNHTKLLVKEQEEKTKEIELNSKEKNTNLLSILNKGLITNNDLAKFITEFQNKNPAFCNRLNEKHPELTTTDFKFIALIKLNLSGNEIADTLNLTLSGVKKAKSRIKNKLLIDTATISVNQYIKTL